MNFYRKSRCNMKKQTKKTKIKQFKCEECGEMFPCLKLNTLNQLLSAKKYINSKIVCGRCYYTIREKNRLGLTKNPKIPLWLGEMNKK